MPGNCCVTEDAELGAARAESRGKAERRRTLWHLAPAHWHYRLTTGIGECSIRKRSNRAFGHRDNGPSADKMCSNELAPEQRTDNAKLTTDSPAADDAKEQKQGN